MFDDRGHVIGKLVVGNLLGYALALVHDGIPICGKRPLAQVRHSSQAENLLLEVVDALERPAQRAALAQIQHDKQNEQHEKDECDGNPGVFDAECRSRRTECLLYGVVWYLHSAHNSPLSGAGIIGLKKFEKKLDSNGGLP